jgi:hypothetical protein
MKADRAAKNIVADKVAAERRRSYERQEMAKVQIEEQAKLKRYEAQAGKTRFERLKEGLAEARSLRQPVQQSKGTSRRKRRGKSRLRTAEAAASRMGGGGQSSSPFSPSQAAPSGSDKTRDIFGMGKKKNVFYD